MPAATKAAAKMTGIVVDWVKPSWFKIPIVNLPIQNFGLFIGLSFLTSGTILEIETQRQRLDIDVAETVLIAMITGVLGSKLHCTFSEIISGSKVTPFFSGSGLSFQGGFLFATLCIMINVKLIKKQNGLAKFMDAMAPALVTGYAVGKIGCFTAGDGCYGIPTKQPYGMHFPNALVPTKGPVHSVPLYEFAFNAILFTFLMIRVRVGSPKPVLNNVGVMFTGLGTLRFCIEYVRTNPIVKWGMTEYQFIALGMVIFGVFLTLFTHTALARKWFGPAHINGAEDRVKEKETELADQSGVQKNAEKASKKSKKAKAH